MKRLFAVMLAVCIVIASLSGCAAKSGNDMSAAELEKLYSDAITGARDDELNEAYPVTLGSNDVSDEVVADMLNQLLGFSAEDAYACAISVSLMNTQAYGIVAVKPAEGKEDTVKDGLQGFIDQQCANFELYLADQYDIAKSARLETLDDGTVLMVMCPDQDTVFNSIAKSIENA